MTAFRVCVLFAALALLALAVVYLRTEQTRSAARTLKLESRWVELRRELWQAQTGVARLQAPEQVHDRLGWFQSDLVPPAVVAQSATGPRPKRLASSQP
ncbi:MAG: hypothetical protein HY763_05385 [Planctomycetes bacterium]|nr:hypothetical protein [Planctomycetota bacterium]